MSPTLQRWGSTAAAVALILLGIVVAADALTMRIAPTYARVGPALIPQIVAGGLVIVGGGLLFSALYRPAPAPPPDDVPLHWPPLGWIAAGLAAQAVLMVPAGFVIASAALFALSARAFDSRRPLVDALIGLGLAGLCYVAFVYGLGLHLPAGVLGRVL